MALPAKARELTPPAPAALPAALLLVVLGGAAWAWQGVQGGGTTLPAVVLGVGVLWLVQVLIRRHTTRAYVQAMFESTPSPVGVGQAFRVRLLLPHAAALQCPLTLRVVQRRVDTSNSSHESSLEWEQSHGVSPVPQPDGQHRLEAAFQLPADAPATGFYRGGCQVQWRVQLIDAQGLARLSYELPVRADRSAPAASALGEPLFAERPIDELPGGKVSVAPTWQESEDSGGFGWRFRRPVMRVLGGWCAVGVAAAGVLLVRAVDPGTGGFRLPAEELLTILWGAALVPFAVHGLTARWWLRVDDDGLAVDRSSWMWPRRIALGGLPLEQVSRMAVAVAGPADNDRAWYRLIATRPDGVRHWLTPRLRGPGLAQELSRRLQVAYRQRGARFTPGGVRRRASVWPWLRALALWAAWIGAVALALSRGVALVG